MKDYQRSLPSFDSGWHVILSKQTRILKKTSDKNFFDVLVRETSPLACWRRSDLRSKKLFTKVSPFKQLSIFSNSSLMLWGTPLLDRFISSVSGSIPR
jgi:hypothetical protein